MEDSRMPGITIFGDSGKYLKRRGQGCKGKGLQESLEIDLFIKTRQ
jgi:hypothetical protein